MRLLIADDHRIVRAGVREMLSLSNAPLAFEVEEAETSGEAVKMVVEKHFDLVLMDYLLQDQLGPKGTRMILQRSPATAVICLSSYDELHYVHQMMEAGARGYILKNVEPDTLVFAIKTVLGGKPFYSNEIALRLMYPQLRPSAKERVRLLTSRELEVFRLLLAGLTSNAIAAKLHISKRTIDKHRHHLMIKLDVHNAVGLARAGLELGL